MVESFGAGRGVISFTSYIVDKEIAFVSHGDCDPQWFKEECDRVGLRVPEQWKFANSIDLAHKLLGNFASVSLESLSQRYGIVR